jgi:hypothetical protein
VVREKQLVARNIPNVGSGHAEHEPGEFRPVRQPTDREIIEKQS